MNADVGSGDEEEDQYMHMVVANLLQKHQAYVSIARGGFKSLMEYLTDVGIDVSEWIVGAERGSGTGKNSTGDLLSKNYFVDCKLTSASSCSNSLFFIVANNSSLHLHSASNVWLSEAQYLAICLLKEKPTICFVHLGKKLHPD